MPPPRKSDQERAVRWDALYVTAADRAKIKAAAQAADLSVSRYLVSLHRDETPWRDLARAKVVGALIGAERRLEDLARMVTDGTSEIDAVRLQAQLLDIERSFRREALLPGAVRGGASDEEGEAGPRIAVDHALWVYREIAFAGVPECYRPPLFATTHIHTGHPEVNIIVPRWAGRSEGAIRAFNPDPPYGANRAA
jgi:hypothetical protein